MKLFIVLLLSNVALAFAADSKLAKEIVQNMNQYIARYDEHKLKNLFHPSFSFNDCSANLNRIDFAKFLLLENGTYAEPTRFAESKTGFFFATKGEDKRTVLYQTVLAKKSTYEIISGRLQLADRNCPFD